MKKRIATLLTSFLLIGFLSNSLNAQLQTINLSFENEGTEVPRTMVTVIYAEDTLATGFANTSGVFSFDINPDAVGIRLFPAKDVPELRVWPNPASNFHVTVSYSPDLNLTSPRIAIFDLSGRELNKDSYFEVGVYTLVINSELSENFIINEPGFYSFTILPSVPVEGLKKSSQEDGIPLRILASKPEFLPFEDTLYFNEGNAYQTILLTKALKPAPSISINGSYIEDGLIFFNAGGSVAAYENDSLRYTWNFGNGQKSGGERTSHIYAEPGAFTLTLTAIGKYGASNSVTEVLNISPNLTFSTGEAEVNIVVEDTRGEPVSGASVIVEGAENQYNTNQDGIAQVTVPVGIEVLVTVDAEGYASQMMNFNITTGNEQGEYRFTLVERGDEVRIDNAEMGFNYRSDNGPKISIPLEGLVRSDGSLVTGSVDLSMTPVDVSDNQELGAFPGEFSGITPDGRAPLILTYGVSEYVLEQNGEKLQLAEGKFASIEIPVYVTTHSDGTEILLGDQLPVWSLNEKTGTWVMENMGTVIENENSPTGLALLAEVSHFSWWNCDVDDDPFWPNPRCFVRDVDGNQLLELPGNEICLIIGEILGPNGPRNRPVSVGCCNDLPVPSNTDVRLTAYAYNGTYTGSKVVNGGGGVYSSVSIVMSPLFTGDEGGLIVPDTVFTAQIENATDSDIYEFDVIAGETYNLSIFATEVSTLTGRVIFYDTNGSPVDNGEFGQQGYNYAFTATEEGRIRFSVNGTENFPGAYTLILDKVPVITPDQNFEVNLLYRNHTERIKVRAEKDQLLYLHTNADLFLRYHVVLKDPNGNALYDRQITNGRNIPGYIEIKSTGDYILEISSTSTGNYLITGSISKIDEPVRFPDNETISSVSDSIEIHGKPYLVSFNGEKGDVVNFAVFLQDSMLAKYELITPGPQPFYERILWRSDQVSTTNGVAYGETQNGRVELPEDGEYYLRLIPSGLYEKTSYRGRFTLSLFRPEIEDISLDVLKEDSIDVPFDFRRYRIALERPTSLGFVHRNFTSPGYLNTVVYDAAGNERKRMRSNIFAAEIASAEMNEVYIDSVVYIEMNADLNGSGKFSLEVIEHEEPVELVSAVPWTEVEGEIRKEEDVNYYRIEAQAGQILGATLERKEGSTLSGFFRVYPELGTEQAGYTYGTNIFDNVYNSATDLFTPDMMISNITTEIPVTGNYIIKVDGDDGLIEESLKSGDYILRVNLVEPAGEIIVDSRPEGNPSASTGFLQSAIRASSENGQIQIEPGIYKEQGGIIVQNRGIEIFGADSASTEIQLFGNLGIFLRAGDLRFRDFKARSEGAGFNVASQASNISFDAIHYTGNREFINTSGFNDNIGIENSWIQGNSNAIINIVGDSSRINNVSVNTEGGEANNGVQISGKQYLISNCTFGGSGEITLTYSGIFALGGDGRIDNNVFNSYEYGIIINGSTFNRPKNVEILNNTFGNPDSGFLFEAVNGILAAYVDSAIVHNNYFNTDVDVTQAIRFLNSNGDVFNNRIHIVRGTGVSIETSSTDPETKVYNNTLVKSNNDFFRPIMQITGNASLNIRIYNNILFRPQTDDATHLGISSNVDIQELDYNVFFGHATGSNLSPSLTQRSSNITGNPNFIDDQLRINDISPAWNSGKNAGAPDTDFEGDIRPQGGTVDIGADEFIE